MVSLRIALLGLLVLTCLQGRTQSSLAVTITSVKDTLCSGSSTLLTSTVSGANGSVSYQWLYDGGIISGATSSTYTFTSNSDSPQISCEVKTSTQTWATSNAITIIGLLAAQVPQYIYLTSPDNEGGNAFCHGNPATASTLVTPGSNSFNWSLYPDTAGTMTVSATTDSVFLTWNPNFSDSAKLSVTANGCNGTTAADSLYELVYPRTGPVVITAYADTACAIGPTITYNYSGSATNSRDFWWDTYSSNVVQSSPGTFYFTAPGFDTITLVEVGLCSVSSANVTVQVLGPFSGGTTLIGPTTLCQGQPLTQYRDSTVNAWKGTVWSISPTTAGTVTDSGLVQISPTYSGTATIQAVAIGCSSVKLPGSIKTKSITAKSTVTITPSKTLTVSLSPMSTQFCSNESFTFTATSNLPATGYQWQINGSPVSGVTGSTFTANATSASELQSVQVTADAAFNTVCSTDTVATASASGVSFTQVQYEPASVSIADAFTTVGTQSTFTFTATPIMGGTSPGYQWEMNGVNIPGATGSTYSASSTAVKGQSIGVVLTSSNGCASPSVVCQVININW